MCKNLKILDLLIVPERPGGISIMRLLHNISQRQIQDLDDLDRDL